MREQNVVIWSGIADLALSFLRNGVAYAYLIRRVLDGSISVSMFLLYFTAVGILTNLSICYAYRSRTLQFTF